MIRGVVNGRLEAVIHLRVRGAAGSELDTEAIIDSGFTGSLTLASADVSELGLLRQSKGEAILADGSVQEFDIYAAEVEWNGTWRPVLISALGAEALVGMRLLAGHELRIETVPNEAVTISLIP